MIQELLYTADSKGGLKGGGSGFSTVLSTEGMASNLAQALERLSGYKHPFDIHDPRSQQITVNYRHAKIKVGGITYHVLSRIADLRHKSTSRSNKLAHHVVLTNSDLPIGGPSHVLAHQGFCRTNWDGLATLVPAIPVSSLPKDDLPARPCENWKVVAGDAGWAGFVAEQLHLKPQASVNVIFPLGTDTLALTNEVFSLLPPNKRWELTFSTYFTSLPAGTSCSLRFYLDGTSAADNLRRDYRQTIVDLAEPLDAPEESDWVQCARTGKARTLDKPSKTAGRPAAELEDGEDPEVLIVEETATFRQNQLANPDETTEDLSLLPPSSTRPLSSLVDSFPQEIGAGHTMTDFQRKLRNKRRRKFLITGTVLAIFAVLLIVGGTFVVSFLKGFENRQEANNESVSGEAGIPNNAISISTEETVGKNPINKPKDAKPKAEGVSITSESGSEPKEETDEGKQNTSEGDKSSTNSEAKSIGEVTPIELTLNVPYLKSPEKGGNAKAIEVELPKNWLSEDSQVNISQIGLNKLNHQAHENLSLQENPPSSRKWVLVYESTGSGVVSTPKKKRLQIANLWLEENAIHFAWNEADKDVVKDFRVLKKRAFFNGIRWCLLEARTRGKPPIILRLSNFEKAKQVSLVSEKGGHSLQELQANGNENSVLPNGSLMLLDVELLNVPKDLPVETSHENLKHKFNVSCILPSQKGAESSRKRPIKMLAIEIALRPSKTLDDSIVSVTCHLLISKKHLDTLERLNKKHGRREPPRFERTMELAELSRIREYLNWIRSDGQNMLKQELDRIESDRKERKKQKQQADSEKANGKREDQLKKRELRLRGAKLWCEAAVRSLRYLQSASARVSVSAKYTNKNEEHLVPILSNN